MKSFKSVIWLATFLIIILLALVAGVPTATGSHDPMAEMSQSGGL